MNDWVSVQQRLPEHPGRYLAWVNRAQAQIVYFSNGVWRMEHNVNPERQPIVTHWMDLPGIPSNMA